MITRDMPEIDRALNESSWQWLQAENEQLADAVAKQVSAGTPPQSIFEHIVKRVGWHRVALARRVKQAAEHLQGSGQ